MAAEAAAAVDDVAETGSTFHCNDGVVRKARKAVGMTSGIVRECALYVRLGKHDGHHHRVPVARKIEADLDALVVVLHIDLGVTLQQLLCATGELRSDQVLLEISEDLLCAIDWLHACGIAHCDIKPSNIMVNPSSSSSSSGTTHRFTVKLFDFDISVSRWTPTGRGAAGLVTWWYRPPELLIESACSAAPCSDIIRNPELFDRAVRYDMWSAGLVIAQMALSLPRKPAMFSWFVKIQSSVIVQLPVISLIASFLGASLPLHSHPFPGAIAPPPPHARHPDFAALWTPHHQKSSPAPRFIILGPGALDHDSVPETPSIYELSFRSETNRHGTDVFSEIMGARSSRACAQRIAEAVATLMAVNPWRRPSRAADALGLPCHPPLDAPPTADIPGIVVGARQPQCEAAARHAIALCLSGKSCFPLGSLDSVLTQRTDFCWGADPNPNPNAQRTDFVLSAGKDMSLGLRSETCPHDTEVCPLRLVTPVNQGTSPKGNPDAAVLLQALCVAERAAMFCLRLGVGHPDSDSALAHTAATLAAALSSTAGTQHTRETLKLLAKLGYDADIASPSDAAASLISSSFVDTFVACESSPIDVFGCCSSADVDAALADALIAAHAAGLGILILGSVPSVMRGVSLDCASLQADFNICLAAAAAAIPPVIANYIALDSPHDPLIHRSFVAAARSLVSLIAPQFAPLISQK